MTDQQAFDVTILLDRSGSMQSIKGDMEGAIARFVSDQAKLPGKCLLSLYRFDQEFEQVFAGADIRSAPKIDLEPRGGTALLDAMAQAIDQTGARLAAMPETGRPGRVVFTVITDGEENASRKVTFEDVSERVARQSKDYKWEFVFLGAGLDSFAQGGALGIKTSSNYTASPAGVQHAMANYSAAMCSSRSTGATMDMAEDLTVPTWTATPSSNKKA